MLRRTRAEAAFLSPPPKDVLETVRTPTSQVHVVHAPDSGNVVKDKKERKSRKTHKGEFTPGTLMRELCMVNSSVGVPMPSTVERQTARRDARRSAKKKKMSDKELADVAPTQPVPVAGLPTGDNQPSLAAQAMPAPQMKLVDGKLVLAEDSLQVTASNQRQTHEYDVVYETNTYITSASYTNRSNPDKWTDLETLKFYKSLSQLGTDFSLMAQLFPGRTRKQLKSKFKREERLFPRKVDEALTGRLSISMDDFEKAQEETRKKKEEAEAKKQAAKDAEAERSKKRSKKSPAAPASAAPRSATAAVPVDVEEEGEAEETAATEEQAPAAAPSQGATTTTTTTAAATTTSSTTTTTTTTTSAPAASTATTAEGAKALQMLGKGKGKSAPRSSLFGLAKGKGKMRMKGKGKVVARLSKMTAKGKGKLISSPSRKRARSTTE